SSPTTRWSRRATARNAPSSRARSAWAASGGRARRGAGDSPRPRTSAGHYPTVVPSRPRGGWRAAARNAPPPPPARLAPGVRRCLLLRERVLGDLERLLQPGRAPIVVEADLGDALLDPFLVRGLHLRRLILQCRDL